MLKHLVVSVSIIGLVILRPAKPYNMKVAQEAEPGHLMEEPMASPEEIAVFPSPASELSRGMEQQQMDEEDSYSSWQAVAEQAAAGLASPADGVHPSNRWKPDRGLSSAENDDHRTVTSSCPSNYEEIIGYCADSPIGTPLQASRFECARQCSANPDCLGFSWDREADGETKQFSCTLQHTECRFPTYSSRFGFCRKRSVKPTPRFPRPPPPAPVLPPFEVPPIEMPPVGREEPNTEILRAYLSTYDQICDSDKHFKTSTVFTCAQYCLADAGCQAFSYDQSVRICRFIGHCQQKQVFKKLFGSSGMPDILSLFNFILSRANGPPGLLGAATMAGQLQAGSAYPMPTLHHRPTPPAPPPPLISPYPSAYKPYSSSEEHFYLGRRPSYRLLHRRRYGSHEHSFDRSMERRVMHGFDRMDGDCQSPLLDNKVYELNAYECARRCHRRPDCAGFSVNLYVSSPHECYLRAETCSTPISSSVWVYFRKVEPFIRRQPSPAPPPPSAAMRQQEENPVTSSSTKSALKTENMFSFYDFLQGNVNASTGQQFPRNVRTPQKKVKKYRARSSNSRDLPTMTRRALKFYGSTKPVAFIRHHEQPVVPPQKKPVPRRHYPSKKPAVTSSTKQPRGDSRDDKALEFYTPMAGNCRGNVIETVQASLNECAARCIQTTKCLGFAFDEWENRCFIKANKCLHPEPSPNGIVYYQLRI